MADIPMKDALLLWNTPLCENHEPAFAVRPLGHPDYNRYDMQNGACFLSWREVAERPKPALLCQMMVELWHIVAFYRVPIEMVHEAMLVVPEYRNMLADDCLPEQWRFEREY